MLSLQHGFPGWGNRCLSRASSCDRPTRVTQLRQLQVSHATPAVPAGWRCQGNGRWSCFTSAPPTRSVSGTQTTSLAGTAQELSATLEHKSRPCPLPRDRSYIIQADCPRLCEMLPGMEVSSPLLRGKQEGAHEEGECYLESVCVYPTGWAMWKVPSSSSAVETTFMSRLLLPLCPWSSVHPCGGLRVQGSSTHQTSQSSAAHGPGTGSSGYSCST